MCKDLKLWVSVTRQNFKWVKIKKNQLGRIRVEVLKFICINYGDQRVFSI